MFIFPALLMLHLMALVLMSGTTLIDFINYQTFWKLFDRQEEQAVGVLSATARFPRLIGIGAGLLVVSGAGMIALTHGLLAEQLWFRIKFAIVLLLIGNSILNGNRAGVKLRKLVVSDAPYLTTQVMSLKNRLRIFHLLQLCIFVIIIFLSASQFRYF